MRVRVRHTISMDIYGSVSRLVASRGKPHKWVLDGFKSDIFPGALVKNLNFRDIYLSGYTLNGIRLLNCNFKGADLSGANLRDADLRGSDFSGADLSRADLTFAKVSRANFTDANLYSAIVSHSNLRGAIVNGAILTKVFWGDVMDVEHSTKDIAKVPRGYRFDALHGLLIMTDETLSKIANMHGVDEELVGALYEAHPEVSIEGLSTLLGSISRARQDSNNVIGA